MSVSAGKNGLVWNICHETLRIEPWGADSLRVRATANAHIRDDLLHALLPPKRTKARIRIENNCGFITNGAITGRISAAGEISFLRTADKSELLAEFPVWFPLYEGRTIKAGVGDLWRIETRFKAYKDERIHGLGHHQHGQFDQKGCVIPLAQRNAEASVPFYVSSRGYGFLWNNPAVGRVEVSKDQTHWIADATPQMDYWVTVGKTPARIMENYADATGHPSDFPQFASGFWQCKLRYRTQDELLSVAREYKRRGLPLSVIVIDYFHWTRQGEWQFDPKCWPDPAAMVRELNEMGVKLMVSVWPTVNVKAETYDTMSRRGMLVRTARGMNCHTSIYDNDTIPGNAHVSYYDPTNPEARKFIWERVRKGYRKYGIKMWWLDACEPEMYPMNPDNLRFHAGHGEAVANIYPMLHERAFYEGMKSEGEKEIVNLCRCAWAGSQRYGAVIWSGDIRSTFEVLQIQVRAGLNMAMSGIPWWNTDIGGFLDGDIRSPYFRELIVRWFQYGTFCPVMRLHGCRKPQKPDGTEADNEVWSFGDKAYEILKQYLFLRERLRPYIMKQMRVASNRGAPVMRPLFFDFPADKDAAAIEDQFMFGPDLLVAPVLFEGARKRDVYLPAGATWTDAWTGRKFKGGHTIEADAPLERIPLYLRGNAKLRIVR